MTLTSHTMLTECSCGICDMAFAVPRTFWKRGKETGGPIYCPAGHEMAFGESEIERLRRERARLTSRLDQVRADRDATGRRLAAARGQVTKIKNRVGKGVCPCCNRHFANVERHMSTQHPDFVSVGG